MGNKLVIKAPPRRVHEIRQLLAELDRPPRQLRITVGKGDDDLQGSRGYNASADIRLGDNSQISINSPGRPVDSSRAQLQLRDRSSTTIRSSQQFVQAMEGQPAFISSGLRVPLRTTEGYYGAGAPYYRSRTQLHDVTGGFYVVPRVSGEIVTLEIMQHDDRPGQHRGVIDTQRVNTRVQGRLGDWIDLGGLDQSEASQQDGIGRSINSQQGQLQGIRVKVECVNC
jgi:type II secretory pathway component HofQ